MKKYINKLIALSAIAIFGASCEGDDALTTLATVNFAAPIEASAGTVALNADNKYIPVQTISWQDVRFPVNAPVTYALQFDVPSDTIGDTAWQHAKTLQVGENVLSKSFIGADLNDLALDLGIPADSLGQIVIRATATLDRTIYSDPIVINVTPFVQVITITEIYMPGSYQGWNPATAARLVAIDAGVFQGYATFPAGSLGFKITIERDWDEFYGSTGGSGIAEHDDDDLHVPAAGSYQITVNLNTNTFTAVPYTFGIIGPATPGGWDADTDMTYDHVAEQWTYTGNLVPGALKFRLNDAWTINYGANNSTDGIMYFDNQGAYTVTDAGNYTVTFAVDPNPATARYAVTRN